MPGRYGARFLEGRWRDLKALDPASLVADLQDYVTGDAKAFSTDDPRFDAYIRALIRLRPDPKDLLPLLAPRGPATEVDVHCIKHDLVALGVVASFYRRVQLGDPARGALCDAIALAGCNFSFDPIYGDSYTRTGQAVSDFFADEKIPPDAATRTALRAHLDPLLARWEKRASDNSTSTLFGDVLRQLGAEGAVRLVQEWGAMHADERVDFLERLGYEEHLPATVRKRIVDGLLDGRPRVREAALHALRRLGAPTSQVDPSAPDAQLREALAPLRAWARHDGDS